MELWKRHFANDRGNRTIHKTQDCVDKPEEIHSAEDLRNICYEFLTKEMEAQTSDRQCNGATGWCATYLFGKGWYETSDNY